MPSRTPKRDHEQHDRDGRRAGRVVALDLAEDVDRRDLGLERDVPRDQHDRAELADRAARTRARRRRGSPGSRFGKHDPPEDRQRARRRARPPPPPSRGRARAAPAAPCGPRTAASRRAAPATTASPGVRDVDADRAVRPVEREQRQPGDDRRQRERQVDQRVDDALAREPVTHEHPRDRSCPMTALIEHDRRARATSVSLSAETACGSVTASQNPSARPSTRARRPPPAASRTIRLRYAVASRQPTAAPGCAPLRLAEGSRLVRQGSAPTLALLDLRHDPGLRVEEPLVDLRPAAEVA